MPTAFNITNVPVTIDEDKCIADKGCTVCVDVCPLDVLAIDLSKGKAFMKFDECWYCMPCEKDCPTGAVHVDIPYLLRCQHPDKTRTGFFIRGNNNAIASTDLQNAIRYFDRRRGEHHGWRRQRRNYPYRDRYTRHHNQLRHRRPAHTRTEIAGKVSAARRQVQGCAIRYPMEELHLRCAADQ